MEEDIFVDEVDELDEGYNGRGYRGRGYRGRGYRRGNWRRYNGRGRGTFREEEEEEREEERTDSRRVRGVIRRIDVRGYYYYRDKNENFQYNYNSKYIPKVELILSYPQIKKDFTLPNKKNKMKLIDFKKKNFMKLKEDILFYCSSPKALENYKNKADEENYEFFVDIESEYFMACQEERFKIIKSIFESKNCPLIKTKMLSNYETSFCAKASFVEKTFETKLINSNIIRAKLKEYSKKIINKINVNEVLNLFKELKTIFQKNALDMEYLGLIQFNFIENNVILLLNLIHNKIEQEKNTKLLSEFTLICIDLLKYFKSSTLYFYIIRNVIQNKIIEGNSLNSLLSKTIVQFLPNNCIEFSFSSTEDFDGDEDEGESLKNDCNNILITNLQDLLIMNDMIDANNSKKDNNIFNNINYGDMTKYNESIQKMIKSFFNTNQYRTLNYDNYLFIFFLPLKNIYEEKDYIVYLKVDIFEKKIIQIGRIKLFINKSQLLDLNISIINELIYILYIYNNIGEIILRFNIYSANDMDLLESKNIEYEKNFKPSRIFHDQKYFYCFSDSNKILIFKKKNKLDNQKYIDCTIRLYDENLIYKYNIANINKFQMFNSLYINNLFILENKDSNQRYIGKFYNNKNNNYILNIYTLKGRDESSYMFKDNIKITHNDDKFLVTYFMEEKDKYSNSINKYNLYIKIASQYCNNLINQNIKLLPFENLSYDNYYPDNLYEYLLKEYSSFLNLCGNFSLVNKKKEHNLIKFPFSLCCNFEQSNLDFLINKIIENNICDNVKLYYIIIAKQIICCLYNSDIFNEEKLSDLIAYFNKLIINQLKKEKNDEKKIFNKILKEIIVISSYINRKSLLEINDIKLYLNDENKILNNKTNLLLIELLLEQFETKKKKELYEYIIQLEKKNLINILRNMNNGNYNNLDLSYYYSLKRIMNKASDTFCKIPGSLETFTTILADCIEDICEEYQKLFLKKKTNEIFDKIFYIYNSFIFRAFFLIIEKIMAGKNLLREEKIIHSIYKVLIALNIISKKLNESDYYDSKNIIEITNESFKKDNRDSYGTSNQIIKIEMKESKGFIIQTYGKITKDFIKIKLKKGNEIINYEFGSEYSFNKIKEIYIITMRDETIENKFIIKIIPLKDEDGFYKFKNNQDYKFILLIQKTIVCYLLFLFKDIHTEIDFNKKEDIKNHIKLYQTDIFKFMSIPDIESMESNDILESSFMKTTNKLIQDINKKFNVKINANQFIDNLSVFINEENKKMNLDKDNKSIINKYDIKIEYINKLESLKKNEKNKNDDKKYDKLFYIFQYNLSSKTNLLINRIKNNKHLDLLISKIFLFGIKYYNCIDKLNNLVKEIESFKKEEIKDNINKIQSIKNYSLFYGLYEASSRMKLIYQEQKNGFNDLNFEEEMEKYFENNLEKIEFMYQNIIPSENADINPNISIINEILNLIEKKDFSIDEIKQYFKIQNFNSKIKLIEMKIINNLLLCMNNEKIIAFLLYLNSKIIRNELNKLNTFFENTYCVDYFIMEKLKYQFHLFLHILSNKIINDKNQFSNMTKISLTESLLWKIRGRNFPILLEIMKVFNDIKTAKIQNNDLFIFDYDKIYNINYFNEKNTLEIKFELFKIFVTQIMKKIIAVLNTEEENILKIERNPSNISETDYKELLKIIFSYFIDINPECLYYYDLVLFFYKLFINSQILQNILLQSYPMIINKIIKLAFGYEKYNNDNENNIENIKANSQPLEAEVLENNKEDNENYNTNRIILNRLIMLKLLSKILENIKDNNIDDLSAIINMFEKENKIIENPFIYFFEKISNNKLNNEEKILSPYYNKLLLICLNNIFESKKNKIIIKNLIQNNFYSIIQLLFDDNFSYMSENDFIIKSPYSNIFEEEAIFNSEETKKDNKGKIICFLKSQKMNIYQYSDRDCKFDDSYTLQKDYYDYLSFESYITDPAINFFDKSFFRFSIKRYANEYSNKNKRNENDIEEVLSIMEDMEKSSYNIRNLKIKEISELRILKGDNEYEKIFISNNCNLIIDIIKDEIKKGNLNEKGIHIVLRIISKLINNINKEDLILIFKYIWDYYENNKFEENNIAFTSLEFIEDFFDNYINIDSLYYSNVYKEENKNKSLSSLFNYIIKRNFLRIVLKKNDIKFFKYKLQIPSVNQEIENYYKNKNYKLTDLSFYKCHDIYSEELINDNSILFIKSIYDNDIEDITKIIEKNNQKIKIIITNIIKVDELKLKNFIEKTEVLIYLLVPIFYKNLIEFFVEGKGKNDYYKSLNSKFIENDEYKDNDCSNFNNKERKQKFLFLSKKKNKGQTLEDLNYNRNELYDEIISNIKMHKIFNLKFIKRLIYDILYSDLIEISELEKIFKRYDNIVYIFEVLCMEYYFNIKHNLPNEVLKNKLKKYLLKIPLKSNDNNGNKWLFFYMNKYICFSDSNISYENYLNYFDKDNLYNENKLLEQFFKLYNNVSYDKLLFLTNHFDKMKNTEYFIKMYFNTLSRIVQNKILPELEKDEEENLDNYDYRDKRNTIQDNYFESFFLSKIMNVLYDYYINLNYCNYIGIQLYEKSILSSNIHKIMKTFIEEHKFDNYISEENDSDYYYIYSRGGRMVRYRREYRRGGRRRRNRDRENGGKKNYTKNISLLFQYIFKYFDFCLFLYFKDEKSDILKYWIKSENKLFEFYANMKVLLMEKNYHKNDYKENISLIAFYSGLMNNYDKDNIINDKIFKMKINKINRYILNDTYDLSFEIEKNEINKNNYKICIFCLENDNTQNYICQDIINLKDMKRFNKEYKIRINKDIYLLPLENVMTSLYTFDHSSDTYKNFTDYYNVGNTYEYSKLTKIEEIPKYSWNIGYGQYKFVLLSENDNKIYIFNCQNEEMSINSKYILDEKINEINTEENKIIDLIEGPKDSPPFLYNDKGEIFSIDENNYKYMWLEEEERESFIYPLKISSMPSKTKIKYISANYNECYAIDYYGNLYQKTIYKRQYEWQNPYWEPIGLEEDKKNFVECKCGDGYLLCLAKDKNGKCSIYAKGDNNVYQCGINFSEGISSNIRGKTIQNLTQCDGTEYLDFQSIYANDSFSAALTTDWKLYIWGLKDKDDYNILPIQKPTLVTSDFNKDLIIEQISLGYNKLFAIGRALENGNYFKKLFSLEAKKLKEKEKLPFILKEVEIMNTKENNSRVIPLKILVGENKAYVLAINEDNLIKIAKENNVDNDKEISININNNKKEYDLDKIKQFYFSDNLNKFMDSFNLLTNANIKQLVSILDEMKKKNKNKENNENNENAIENNENSIENINYNDFITFIEGKSEFKELFSLFKNEQGNTLFEYLKSRILIFQKHFDKFINNYSAIKYNGLFQNALLKNIIYMTEDKRISYFNELLLDMLDDRRDYYSQKSININRFKANQFYEKFNQSSEKIPDVELNETIFGQLFQNYKNTNGNHFVLPKNERLFTAELLGEGAIDAGGPYHETISFMCIELQSNYINLFIKTANNKYNIGELRDKFIVNPDSNKIIYQKAYEFIGKMMAMSISSGEVLNLNLHPIIWKSILENEISFEEYKTIDYSFYNSINELEKQYKAKDVNLFLDFYFVIQNSNESEVELIENGKETKVTQENLSKYIDLVKITRLNEIKNQIKFIKNGLFSAINKNIIQILTWNQLEEIVCGKNKLDINEFKAHTRYEGYNGKEEIITWFWEWLEQAEESDKFKYLKFVSGRTRLPISGMGYNYTHIIIKVSIENKFPRAATCFFSLKLPNYNSKKEFIEKIKYSIDNCTDITDH